MTKKNSPNTEPDDPAEDQGHRSRKKAATKVDSKGQIEMTIAESPIYDACELLIQAKAQMKTAQDAFAHAEKEWLEEMKKIKKKKINHKGDILQYVVGRTLDDHVRFTK